MKFIRLSSSILLASGSAKLHPQRDLTSSGFYIVWAEVQHVECILKHKLRTHNPMEFAEITPTAPSLFLRVHDLESLGFWSEKEFSLIHMNFPSSIVTCQRKIPSQNYYLELSYSLIPAIPIESCIFMRFQHVFSPWK